MSMRRHTHPNEIISRGEAFEEILESTINSGLHYKKIAILLLHLDTHQPTRRRVCLLSRGFSTNETEKCITENKWK